MRKTRPKIETPFKCYIYCTLPPKEELLNFGSFREYANELIRLQDGLIVYDYGMRVCCDIEGRPYSQDNFLCKKVIGEFMCDNIYPIRYEMDGFADAIDCETSCLKPRDFIAYGKGKQLYGWHISNLVIYDKPKELSDFTRLRETKFGYEPVKIERPPQSWCYVEGTVYCKDCKHLMFSDCYAECGKAYKGIVSIDDFCDKGELR